MGALTLTKIATILWWKIDTLGTLLKIEGDVRAEDIWLLEKIIEKIKDISLQNRGAFERKLNY